MFLGFKFSVWQKASFGFLFIFVQYKNRHQGVVIFLYNNTVYFWTAMMAFKSLIFFRWMLYCLTGKNEISVSITVTLLYFPYYFHIALYLLFVSYCHIYFSHTVTFSSMITALFSVALTLQNDSGVTSTRILE